MAKAKTQATKASVNEFLASIENEQQRKDCVALHKLYQEVMGEKGKLWGDAIVGYGLYSLPSGEWPLAAFSPRKAYITLYLMPSYPSVKKLVSKLGKCTTSKACVYIKKLSDIDIKVLKQMILLAAKETSKRYPSK